jgi:pyroglutamyl-peptidase
VPSVLLTGFEPFDGETLNPSLEFVRARHAAPPQGCRLEVLALPVDRFAAVDAVLARIDAGSLDWVVLLGEAGGRAQVTPERIAINVDDYLIPDNAGHQPSSEAVVEGGPAGYFSTLPVKAVAEALHAAGIPGAISNSAGTYLCNRLFYSVMHHLAGRPGATRAGFVHLPYLHQQVLTKRPPPPSLSRATLVEAVRLTLQICLED